MQTYTYNMYIYINYRLLDASQICNEYICIHVYACFSFNTEILIL